MNHFEPGVSAAAGGLGGRRLPLPSPSFPVLGADRSGWLKGSGKPRRLPPDSGPQPSDAQRQQAMHRRWNESDWKAFRKIVPELRERFLEDRNRELVAILDDGRNSPTERFWTAEGRLKEIAGILRACLDGHSRSKMGLSMMLMFRHGMLTVDDLEGFSEDVRGWILEANEAWGDDGEEWQRDK